VQRVLPGQLEVLELQDLLEVLEHLEQQGQRVIPEQLGQRELPDQVDSKVQLEILVPLDLVEPRVGLEQPDFLE